MDAPPEDLDGAVDELVDAYRLCCLWFLRRDYYPTTDGERMRVLAAIQRSGDREAFVRAAKVKAWLSRRSSDRSAGS